MRKARCLPFVAICYHGFNAVDVRAEVTQLDLLALASLNRQRVRINPLVCGHIGRVVRVRQNVEHRRLVHRWQERYGRHDLLQDGTNFSLDLGFGLGWCWGTEKGSDNGVA